MRTLAKTGTYFAMHLTVAIGVAYALSGDWAIALTIGVLEPVVQAGFFALHERVWEGRNRRGARRRWRPRAEGEGRGAGLAVGGRLPMPERRRSLSSPAPPPARPAAARRSPQHWKAPPSAPSARS